MALSLAPFFEASPHPSSPGHGSSLRFRSLTPPPSTRGSRNSPSKQRPSLSQHSPRQITRSLSMPIFDQPSKLPGSSSGQGSLSFVQLPQMQGSLSLPVPQPDPATPGMPPPFLGSLNLPPAQMQGSFAVPSSRGTFPAPLASSEAQQGNTSPLSKAGRGSLRQSLAQLCTASVDDNSGPASGPDALRGRNAVHRSQTPPRTRHSPQGNARLKRVLCYGDSNTAGFQPKTGEHKPYGDHLAEALNESGLEVVMTCCGLDGLTAEEMVHHAQDENVPDAFGRIGKGLLRILEQEGPIDLVILMAGTNDLGRFKGVDSIIPELRKLQAMCCGKGAKTVILGPTTLPEARQMRAHRAQLLETLKGWPHSVPGVVAFYDSEELVPRQRAFWNDDGLHLTPRGLAELGRRLAPLILPLLNSLGSQVAQSPNTNNLWRRHSIAAPVGGPSNQAFTGFSPMSSARFFCGNDALQAIGPQMSLDMSPMCQREQRERREMSPMMQRQREQREMSPMMQRQAPFGFANGRHSLQFNPGSFSMPPASDEVEFFSNPAQMQRQASFGLANGRHSLQFSPGSFSTPAVSDDVEVFSNSTQMWCPASIIQGNASFVVVRMLMPDGSHAQKVLPLGHPSMRKKQVARLV